MKRLYTFGLLACVRLSGCGRKKEPSAPKPSLAARAGNAVKRTVSTTGKYVGENAGAFLSGVAEGVESVVVDYAVRLAEPLEKW